MIYVVWSEFPRHSHSFMVTKSGIFASFHVLDSLTSQLSSGHSQNPRATPKKRNRRFFEPKPEIKKSSCIFRFCGYKSELISDLSFSFIFSYVPITCAESGRRGMMGPKSRVEAFHATRLRLRRGHRGRRCDVEGEGAIAASVSRLRP